jgi:membrane associated rhomboid family serine protease
MNYTLIIVIVTTGISLLALNRPEIAGKLTFWPYGMWRDNQWYRILTSGFIHANVFPHLVFNMIALYSFGLNVEYRFEEVFGQKSYILYLIMYLGAIVVSGLYDLFRHRDDYNYQALGASGGVSAIIFASILFDPFSSIYIYMAFPIPAFIFGPLYLVYCVYMAKRGQDHIGHTAHFTGAVFGFLFPILLKPALLTNFIYLLLHGK